MVTSRSVSVAAGFAAAVVLVQTASAIVVPFTEGFATDAAGWRARDGVSPLGFNPAGGPDGSSYASTAFSFSANLAGDQVTLIRGEDTFGSSAGNLFGNYLANQVSTLSFVVRHNATEPLTFFLRVARSLSNPGGTTGVAAIFAGVPANEWTTLTLPIAFNPALTYEGPPTLPFHNAIFSAIARLQIGVTNLPAGVAGATPAFTFDIDQVRIIPTPSAAAALGLLLAPALRRRRH